MVIIVYIWIFCILISALFVVVTDFVENKIDDDHQFKKWWRENIIGLDPESQNSKDDIQE